jgi:hypothetical protein
MKEKQYSNYEQYISEAENHLNKIEKVVMIIVKKSPTNVLFE